MTNGRAVFEKFTQSFYRDEWEKYLTTRSRSLWGTEMPASIGALQHLDVPVSQIYASHRETPGFAEAQARIKQDAEKSRTTFPGPRYLTVVRARKLECLLYDPAHILFRVDRNAAPLFATIQLDVYAGARVVREMFYSDAVTEYRSEDAIYVLGSCPPRTAIDNFVAYLAALARREMT